MRRIYEADDGIRNAKLRVLAKIQELAAYVCQCQENGTIRYTDSGFFYKALSYVSYDMDEAALLGLLDEAENIERDIKAGEIQNDSEDYKN